VARTRATPDVTPPPTRPAEKTADAIHSAAIHLLRSLRRQDASLGVGPAGLSVLSVVVFSGPKTISQLAAIEQVTKATMSRIIQRLERWGIVERTREGDRRRAIIRPTTTGRSLMRRGRYNRVAELETRMRDLSDQEIAILARAAQLIDDLSKRDALP
jgi:DNA-binding MarR family transcriptional regulator